jgi:translation initiation factor IF-2
MKKKIRKYSDALNKIAVYEVGGGTTNVEGRASMSINEMYARMLKQGEVAATMKLKSNNHGSIERADALMDAATVPPLYMRSGDMHETIEKMGKLDKKLKDEAKIIEFNNRVDEEIKKRGSK